MRNDNASGDENMPEYCFKRIKGMSSCRGTCRTRAVLTDDGSGGEVVCDDTRFTGLNGENHLKNRSEV